MRSALRVGIVLAGVCTFTPFIAFAQQFGGGPGGPPPGPPSDTVTVNDVSANVTSGSSVSIQLSGSTTGAGTLTFATSSDPLNGTLGAIGNDGSVIYTPTSAFTGSDSFTYTASDGTANSSDATVSITVTASAPAVSSVGSGGAVLHDPFNIPLAILYLQSKEDSQNGSFDSAMLTDWVAIATAGGNAGDLRTRLTGYEKAVQPQFSSVLGYEQHAMALESLGIDPYTGTPTDYIASITSAYDGTEIGASSDVANDIFAIFPLVHAGYTESDGIIERTTAYILSQQKSDGSFAEDPGLTAAAIQALGSVRSLPGTSDAITKASFYLHTAQKQDGSFNSTADTSWADQAIAALGGSVFDWSHNSYATPDYYLATIQQSDGAVESTGVGDQVRILATAYAIPAVEHKSWNDLLQSFSKPTPPPAPAAAGATTTAAIATSTETTDATPIPAPMPKPVPVQMEAVAATTTATSSADVATTSDEIAPVEPEASSTQVAAVGEISVQRDWTETIPFFALLIMTIAALLLYRRNRETED